MARAGIADEGGVGSRAPFSPAAVAVLERMRGLLTGGADSLIFPGVGGRRLNGYPLTKPLRPATGTDADVHGFRSSFRTWATERSAATRDVAELALAHVVGAAVERSYTRSDLFDQRRVLMDRWARVRDRLRGYPAASVAAKERSRWSSTAGAGVHSSAQKPRVRRRHSP